MSEPTASSPPTAALVAAVEAVLFAAAEPVQPREIAAAFESVTEDEVALAIDALRERYAAGEGGLTVEQVAGAYRLATRPEVGPLVRQFFRQRNRTRLSAAALETLAIIAYRQPLTSPEIQAVRGVDPAGAIKSLLEKKMIRILGRKRVVGNPLLYGTTKHFLVHFGLNRLEDLPSIEEFDQFVGAVEGLAPGAELREPAEAAGQADPAGAPEPVAGE
ncbi:MAG TPA: SMC-Scp complex subunit ScpB [Candidatus Polarisedimenticolaceae bacterium]|nr:SMC-Scp complex subunit ScpB [Candidatus Polarisedimenticolaceae bacterium]